MSKTVDSPNPPEESVTELLLRLGSGDDSVYSELMPKVYEGLREIAKRHMQHERPDHTLEPTALVHEAFLRLVDQDRTTWESRTHFLCVGAKAMRRVLVDHARARGRLKRGGGVELLSLEDSPAPIRVELPDLVALDLALTDLYGQYPRQAEVVELMHFGGLTVDEIAAALNISCRTVLRDSRFARSWLLRALRPTRRDSGAHPGQGSAVE